MFCGVSPIFLTSLSIAKLFIKSGVTGGDVSKRFANARLDSTFLMAEVEVVATYELSNINRVKLENLIHSFFEAARLDIEINDRFGNPVTPREWFLVPLEAIDDLIQKIVSNEVVNYRYNPQKAALELLASNK